MVNLWYTCCCFVDQTCSPWGVLYVKCFCMHTCCHIMRSPHFVLFEPIWTTQFQFLNGNIKWAVVLRECCLGGPLGFLLIPHCERISEELNPASWPPLCSRCFYPWFLCGTALHLFPNSSADVVCVLYSLHLLLYFPLPRAGFCCGYWVPCWSQPKISCVLCCCFLTSVQNFRLLWFCSAPTCAWYFCFAVLLCSFKYMQIYGEVEY